MSPRVWIRTLFCMLLVLICLAIADSPIYAYCHDGCSTSGTYHNECANWGSGCNDCCSRNYAWTSQIICQLCNPDGPTGGVCRNESELTTCANNNADWYNCCIDACEQSPQCEPGVDPGCGSSGAPAPPSLDAFLRGLETRKAESCRR